MTNTEVDASLGALIAYVAEKNPTGKKRERITQLAKFYIEAFPHSTRTNNIIRKKLQVADSGL
jgi:hypothetical protein